MVDETPRIHSRATLPVHEARWSTLSFAIGVVVGTLGVCLALVLVVGLA